MKCVCFYQRWAVEVFSLHETYILKLHNYCCSIRSLLQLRTVCCFLRLYWLCTSNTYCNTFCNFEHSKKRCQNKLDETLFMAIIGRRTFRMQSFFQPLIGPAMSARGIPHPYWQLIIPYALLTSMLYSVNAAQNNLLQSATLHVSRTSNFSCLHKK